MRHRGQSCCRIPRNAPTFGFNDAARRSVDRKFDLHDVMATLTTSLPLQPSRISRSSTFLDVCVTGRTPKDVAYADPCSSLAVPITANFTLSVNRRKHHGGAARAHMLVHRLAAAGFAPASKYSYLVVLK
jgi:hypothetical protein